MKKSSITAMVLGTVSGLMFAIGMCMALIPEWGARKPGIIFGSVGLLFALITVIVWRRMEHKEHIHISVKTFLVFVSGVAGVLALGVGMCFVMVWDKLITGIVVGIAGIVILLCLIPLTKGIKE